MTSSLIDYGCVFSMFQDKRSQKIVVVAHCILNQNARVFGIAWRPGMILEIIEVLKAHGVGVVQMPCPELTYAGLNRWSHTKEQYATPMFRRHCEQIATSITDQIQEYLKNGFNVYAILGVDGSPTCGVNETSVGFKGGDVEKATRLKACFVEGSGVFIEELRAELEKRGISIPMRGVRDKRLKEDVAWLEDTLK